MSKLNVYKSFNNITVKKTVSCIMAVQLIAGSFALFSCKNNQKDVTTDIDETTTSDSLDQDVNISLKTAEELGVELSPLAEDSYYEIISSSPITGSKKVIVDANNAASRSVSDNKATGFQVVDKNGNVVSEGELDSDGIPVGYHKIPGSEDLLPDGVEEVQRDYIGSDGTVVFEKGDVVVEGAGERLEKEVSEATTRIIVEEITSSPEEIIAELIKEGVPEDIAREVVLGKTEETKTGIEELIPEKEEQTTAKVEESTTAIVEESTTEMPAYMKYGFTSQEDYERWLAGEEYVLYNGVMVPYTPEFDNAETTTEYQKTLGGN